jgi:hypothetical protein
MEDAGEMWSVVRYFLLKRNRHFFEIVHHRKKAMPNEISRLIR